MGYTASPAQPRYVDREVLLFFGAVLRLYSWEKAGIYVHRTYGLPSAVELLQDAARSLQEEGTRPDGSGSSTQVLKIFYEQFAWRSGQQLDAPVLLDSLDEGAALDALAAFLWSQPRAESVA